MKFWILVLLVCANTVSAQEVHDAEGNLVGRLSHEGGRSVAHDRIGTLVGTWRQEGGFMVYRAPDGTLLQRLPVK